jgi:transcriptional regulator with XRE-family HTH domain
MNFLQSYESCMDVEARQRLSKAIKQARGQRSQRKFAKDLGVSYATVRSWEECESFPSQENLELIARVRGESLEDFLLYLRGERSSKETRFKVAEDVLPMVNKLSDREAARLVQLIMSRWST